MKDTKDKSSKPTKRAPFQPVTRLEQVPIAFYEIRELATRGDATLIVPLIDSVIALTNATPNALATLPHVAEKEAA